ncbi:hypothetical protein G6F51_014659 [Rhizopus arrhizus]|uniref:Uncharacterized protein n=1 Tax=Rhizopus oryzae TaxID=64495 RepID=A0A9P7BYU4_RHIOR|nr:hypothetical protein G6F51_014659 [Rhizopus arrhizus]
MPAALSGVIRENTVRAGAAGPPTRIVVIAEIDAGGPGGPIGHGQHRIVRRLQRQVQLASMLSVRHGVLGDQVLR